MDSPVLIAGAAGALLLVLCVLLIVLRRRAASRRGLASALAEAQAETAELRNRLEALSEKLERQSSSMIRVDDPAYVITDAGERPEPNVADAVVLTATVGEPLVKVVAFGHGVRRALSAESRNRIWFEMRREVRASRRRRRKAMKAHIRAARAAERVAEQTDAA